MRPKRLVQVIAAVVIDDSPVTYGWKPQLDSRKGSVEVTSPFVFPGFWSLVEIQVIANAVDDVDD
jgi:hypothetical protein